MTVTKTIKYGKSTKRYNKRKPKRAAAFDKKVKGALTKVLNKTVETKRMYDVVTYVANSGGTFTAQTPYLMMPFKGIIQGTNVHQRLGDSINPVGVAVKYMYQAATNFPIFCRMTMVWTAIAVTGQEQIPFDYANLYRQVLGGTSEFRLDTFNTEKVKVVGTKTIKLATQTQGTGNQNIMTGDLYFKVNKTKLQYRTEADSVQTKDGNYLFLVQFSDIVSGQALRLAMTTYFKDL